MRKTQWRIPGAAVLATAAISGSVVWEQNANDGGPGSTAQAQAEGQSDLVDAFIARLATNLGVDEQTLRAAITKTAVEQLDGLWLRAASRRRSRTGRAASTRRAWPARLLSGRN